MVIDPSKPLTVETLARAIDPVCWQMWDERGPCPEYARVNNEPTWYEADRQVSLEHAQRMLDAYVASLDLVPSVGAGGDDAFAPGADMPLH
jgi:hypothetical protein